MQEVFCPFIEATLQTQKIQAPIIFVYTPKIRAPICVHSEANFFLCAFPWKMMKSTCVICLKYFTYQGGIFPNHWIEYFEHSIHMLRYCGKWSNQRKSRKVKVQYIFYGSRKIQRTINGLYDNCNTNGEWATTTMTTTVNTKFEKWANTTTTTAIYIILEAMNYSYM